MSKDFEQLKKTISLVASKNFEYKTAIIGSKPYLYLVVTKVNFLTASLWLNKRNELVKNNSGGNHKGFIELPNKPNWLVMTASFRREETERLKLLTPPQTTGNK